MMEETQKVPCPNCGLPVPMPLGWDGSRPEEALCNACYEKEELLNNLEFTLEVTPTNDEGEYVDASGEPDEGSWHLETWYEGRNVGHAKFDVWENGSGGYSHLLLLQISVDQDMQRRGIATAMLNELSRRYECSISVEDFTPDGRALFGDKYHW
jgi:GNAT superfamily N-acetyltransferase